MLTAFSKNEASKHQNTSSFMEIIEKSKKKYLIIILQLRNNKTRSHI